MYLSEHKLVVEIDEKGHIGRNQNEENGRQTKIVVITNVVITFSVGFILMQKIVILLLKLAKHEITLINRMQKKQNKFAKELLSYMSSISQPLKHIRYFVDKILPTIQPPVIKNK